MDGNSRTDTIARVVLLGLDGAGKTTIFWNYFRNVPFYEVTTNAPNNGFSSGKFEPTPGLMMMVYDVPARSECSAPRKFHQLWQLGMSET